jgi:hypothetical protein
VTNFELKASGGLANGRSWSSRIYASGSVAEDTAATAIHTGWDALWADITTYLPTVSTLTLTAATTLTDTWHYGTRTSTTEALAGTSGSDSMPINTTALITWRSTVVNRHGRGRSKLPAAAVNAIATAADTGLLLPAFKTAIVTGGNALLAALTGAGLTPLLLSRPSLATITITGADQSGLYRTARKRQSKVASAFVD